MRHIGSLPDQATARRFRAWLLSLGMANDIEQEDERWTIWVHDEDLVESARAELENFRSEPRSDLYVQAERALEAAERAAPPRVNPPIPSHPRAGHQWTITPSRSCPATVALMALSALATFACARGLSPAGSFEFQMAYEPVMNRLTIVDIEERPEGIFTSTYNISKAARHLWEAITTDRDFQPPDHGVGQILHGQVWRLVTPAFLHFSIPHILFNLLYLRFLGGEVESKRGLARYLGLILLVAIVSNVGQYAITGSPLFGGMSGVVYGVFGYILMRERFAPQQGLSMPPNTTVWLLGWFFLCLFGVIGGVANGAHAFGLASGLLAGLWPART
ncbi:MAG: rhomboid family intramembrane serine protease [Planctomycetota bacterium]|nr:rhomboid family intramembrane serine protease [Planctomycetota bacterium]